MTRISLIVWTIIYFIHFPNVIFSQQNLLDEAYVSCQNNFIPVSNVKIIGNDLVFDYDAELSANNEQVLSDMWYIFGIAARVYPELKNAVIDYYLDEKKWMSLSLEKPAIMDYVNDRMDEEAVFQKLIMTDYEVQLPDGSYEKSTYGGESNPVDDPAIESQDSNNISDIIIDKEISIPYILLLGLLLLLVGIILFILKKKTLGIIFLFLGGALSLYHFKYEIFTLTETTPTELPDADLLTTLDGIWILNTLDPQYGLVKEKINISVNDEILMGISEKRDIVFNLTKISQNQFTGSIDNKGVKSEVMVSYDSYQQSLNFEVQLGLKVNPTFKLVKE